MHTVLLVEDDDAVLRVVSRMLAKAGYTVLSAGEGRDALAASRKHGGPIDLVITDVVLPDTNGVLLVDQLRPERPALAALYMSGYLDRSLDDFGLESAGRDFIRKPFSPAPLLEKIRSVLACGSVPGGQPEAAARACV